MTTGDKGANAGQAIEPKIISLRTQLVSRGHTKVPLAVTDFMSMHVQCYGPHGGENDLHAHVHEDHVFIVLQGEAQFRGANGLLPPAKKHQAIFLPRGCFYAFSNETNEPLVMARFGAKTKQIAEDVRLDPSGNPVPGRSQKPGAIQPVFIDNMYFE